MDDFLSTISIKKKRKIKCPKCSKPFTLPTGVYYCSSCRKKIDKIENNAYKLNFSRDGQ